METIATHFSAALEHHQAGRWDQAEELYRELLCADPDHSDATHLLGVLDLQRGKPREAIDTIERAIRLKPETAAYHNNLAAAYRADGQLELAVENYERAIALSPDYADAHNNLGNVLGQLGRLDDARRSFQRALALKPHFEVARRNLESVDPPAKSAFPEAAAGQKLVLHVGCGPANPQNLHRRFHGSEWKEIRLDINPDVRPDVVASLTDMRGVASGSVDAVWSSHNLEHLSAHEVPVALAEFYRVLKGGGFALVTLPDLQQVAEFIVADKLEETIYESPAGPITPRDCLFGLGSAIAGGNEYMAHRTGFTAKSLARHLAEAGFADVKVTFAPFALWAEAKKPICSA